MRVKNRFSLLVSEALHSIKTNLSTTVAATMTVFIGMFLLGICIALGTWMVSWSDHTKEGIVVHVYFCSGETCERAANDQQKAATLQRIKQIESQGLVKDYKYVPKDEALQEMKKKHKDLVAGLVTNPLPDAYTITPTHGENATEIASLMRTPPLDGVKKVAFGGKVTKRILRVAQVIEISFVLMVLVLLAASTALIANTIRLSIFSRRREIEVMKLVGATNWFVRGPFMIEGLIVGAGGTIVAIILLLLSKALVLPRVLPHLNTTTDVHAWPFALTAFLLIAAGIGIGVVGSGISLRRYLQI